MLNCYRSAIRGLVGIALASAAVMGVAQPAPRGSVVVFPVIFDKSGTDTSRAKAETALNEVFRKGGFRVVDSRKAADAWRARGMRVPTSARPPQTADLVRVGRAIGVQYVATSHVTFHTRSIWVNLGPKTISTCHMATTIIDVKTGKIVHDVEVDGRSDEKTDKLKVVGALLVSPLVTAVSGGPKTPQETRAAQIAAARSLEKFVTVGAPVAEPFVGTWEWVRFEGMDDSVVNVPQPARYILTLGADGKVSGLADVNRFSGTFSSKGASLSFGPLAATKIGPPPGSLHDQYLRNLRDVASYVIRDGNLYLALKIDGGIMVFRKAR